VAGAGFVIPAAPTEMSRASGHDCSGGPVDPTGEAIDAGGQGVDAGDQAIDASA